MKTPEQIVRAHIEVARTQAHQTLEEALGSLKKASERAAQAVAQRDAFQAMADEAEQQIQAFDAWLNAFPESLPPTKETP